MKLKQKELMNQLKDTLNFEIEFIAEDSTCKLVCTGEINYKQAIGAIHSVVNHQDFHPEQKIIVDLFKMNYHPSYDELLGIVEKFKLHKEEIKGKVALLTTHKMSIVAKLIAIYCELAGMKMKSFVEPEEALAWISEK